MTILFLLINAIRANKRLNPYLNLDYGEGVSVGMILTAIDVFIIWVTIN